MRIRLLPPGVKHVAAHVKKTSGGRCGLVCTRVILMVILCFLFVFAYLGLLAYTFVACMKRGQEQSRIGQPRRTAHRDDLLPPKLPEGALTQITFGPDVVSPQVADELDELLQAFSDVLLVREAIEKYKLK
uniref:CUE domain-containing protein n=1 Tax=Mesocestoides corti TaxID=53468 RepID=A0A5K3FM93_MESCO